MGTVGAVRQRVCDTVSRLGAQLPKAERGIKETAKQAWNTLTQFESEYGKPLARTGYGIGQIIVGAFLGVGSAILKTFVKDSTALDIVGWIGLALSVIFIGDGSRRMLKKEKATEVRSVGTGIEAEAARGERATNALSEVKSIDSNYQIVSSSPQSSSKIYSLDVTDSNVLRPKVSRLLKEYIGILKEDKKIQGALNARAPHAGAEPFITNISDTNLTVPELRQEVAALLGYSVLTRSQEKLEPDLESILGPHEISQGYADACSPIFKLVYAASRDFVGNHEGKNNSVKDILELRSVLGGATSEKLVSIVSAKTGTKKDREAAIDYLVGVQDAYNNLNVLNEAIAYVSSNLKSQDIAKARKAREIVSALICAFRIKGDTSQVNQTLTDKKHGLESKISELKTKYDDLSSNVLSKVIGSELEEHPFGGDDIFPSTLRLRRINEKQII